MVDINKFWIEGVLVEKYPNFIKDLGADLDRNGCIEGQEAFGDLNQNGTVGDREDYKLYLQKNRGSLSANVPFFKWGEKLSVGNRIHQLLWLESDLKSPQLIQSAYHFVARLVEWKKADDLKINIEIAASEEDNTYTDRLKSNKRRVLVTYAMMEKRLGIQYKDQNDSSFSGGVGHKELDCDSSSFAVMAVGDEFGWPLSLVLAPGHAFVRWEKDGERFNVDEGWPNTDDFERNKFKIDPQTISAGIYLKSLTNKELEGVFLFNRGVILLDLERKNEALKVFEKVIELNPNFAEAHYALGIILNNLGRHEEALKAYDKAIELNPKYEWAHGNRGVVLDDLGHYEEALKAYDKVIELNPNSVMAYHNKIVTLSNLSRYKEALEVYKKSVELDPQLADFFLELSLGFQANPIAF